MDAKMTTLGRRAHPPRPPFSRGAPDRWFAEGDTAGAVRRLDLARVFAVLLSLVAFVLVGARADRASALTAAENCALPGSNFQGGDGNQDTPNLTEQVF